MRVRYRAGIWCGILLACALVSSVSAKTIHVPYDYPTITEACAVAQNGDTVAVHEGTYHERANVRSGVSVIGMAADPNLVEVHPLEGGSYTFRACSGDQPVLIEDLTIYGAFQTLLYNSNPQLTVRGCHLYGHTDGFVVISYADFEILECWIDFDSWWENHMFVLCATADVLVEDCVLVRRMWSDWRQPSSSRFEFRNNTFISTEPVLVSLAPGASADISIFFVNNIFSRGARCWGSVPDTVEWCYNDFVREEYWPDCGYQVGNFSADPMFCDPDAGDYRLQWGSPCYGTGEGGEDVGARLGYCWPAGTDPDRQEALSHLHVSTPKPNPAVTGVSLALEAAPGRRVKVQVLDVGGSVIYKLPVVGSGPYSRVHWNGRLADGHLAPAGVYFLRVSCGAEQISRRLTVVR